MTTIGALKPKPYRCTRCGVERQIITNHWGSCLQHCPNCSWKHPLDRYPKFECLEAPPPGFTIPTPR